MTEPTPLPTLDDRVYPTYKIALLVEILQEEGVAPAAALHNSGLDAPALLLPNTRISLRQLLTVYGNALALSNDPAIALRVGRRVHITHYGIYGYALLSSASIRDAAEFSVRYHKLATPLVNMHVQEASGVGAWVFENDFLDARSDLYRFVMEVQFGIHISLTLDMLGPDAGAKPLDIRATYPAPAHAHLYQKYLDCPAHFDQPTNELRFEQGLLDLRPNLANPITAAMLRETCDRMLGELQPLAGVAQRVYGILLQSPGQFPDIERVADMLHMVSRTLRRKLAAEGTSYHQILNDVRKQLALKYLRESHLSTDDIAASLGFSDASSFRQAFKRWTNKNPSDFRAG